MYLSVTVIIPAPVDTRILFASIRLVRLFPSQKNCPLTPHVKTSNALSVAEVSIANKISFNSSVVFSLLGTGGS